MNPNNYLVAMLDTYCQWLNMWMETDEGQTHRYEPIQFIVNDPDTNLYGDSHVHALVSCGESSLYERYLVQAVVYDGDDGGPTELTAWFDIDTDDGTNPLIAMVQGFDTDLQFVYRDRKFVAIPEKESE